jgi:hypothetical protein
MPHVELSGMLQCDVLQPHIASSHMMTMTDSLGMRGLNYEGGNALYKFLAKKRIVSLSLTKNHLIDGAVNKPSVLGQGSDLEPSSLMLQNPSALYSPVNNSGNLLGSSSSLSTSNSLPPSPLSTSLATNPATTSTATATPQSSPMSVKSSPLTSAGSLKQLTSSPLLSTKLQQKEQQPKEQPEDGRLFDFGVLDENPYIASLNLSQNAFMSTIFISSAFNTLTFLSLAHNHIATLTPFSLTNLTSLISLDLSNNSISHVPSTVSTLMCLTRLDLSHNALPKISKHFVSLPALQQLNCDWNKLARVNSDILAELTEKGVEVSLNHNQLLYG